MSNRHPPALCQPVLCTAQIKQWKKAVESHDELKRCAWPHITAMRHRAVAKRRLRPQKPAVVC